MAASLLAARSNKILIERIEGISTLCEGTYRIILKILGQLLHAMKRKKPHQLIRAISVRLQTKK